MTRVPSVESMTSLSASEGGREPTRSSIAADERRVTPGWTRLEIAQRTARSTLLRVLPRLRYGRLEITDEPASARHAFRGTEPGPEARMTIHDPAAWPAILVGGNVGAGESYMDGLWSSTELPAVIEALAANHDVLLALDGRIKPLLQPMRRLAYFLRRNDPRGARRNIAAHYDLDDRLFSLFLDSTMMYSTGIFETPETTMEEASIAKLERICTALDLRPEHHVVEIGTGWGGFALHAAGRYGCRVTTTTISRNQYETARRRVREAGLEDRVTVLERDFRDLEGTYDRLVSIEMIEAVGRAYLDVFFRTCARLLAPDGAAMIQAITIRDCHQVRAARERDWLKKYIFPGSCLPSVAAMAASAARATDFKIDHVEDIGPDYVLTLRRWRDAFESRLDEVRGMFDEQFVRMWRFYLGYCEGAFRARHVGDVQMLLTRPQARLAPIRSRPAAMRGGAAWG